MSNKRLIETIPNFSEGRDMSKVEEIVDAYRGKPGIRLLDYSTDPDHNRCVVTAVGEPEALQAASVRALGTAVRLIDMTQHEGMHPRIGACDVMPFVPVVGVSLQEADTLARAVAKEASERYGLPVFLYDFSASSPHRRDVADIRRGQFEGLAAKMQDPLWKPDFGPGEPHPTAGATIIGAREPIVYFNVNLSTANLDIATRIARRLRNRDGGLRYLKALGLISETTGQALVTMNLTDYSRSALYTALELVKIEAARYGVTVVSSEIAGYVPYRALVDTALYYLQVEDFDYSQVLEQNLDLSL